MKNNFSDGNKQVWHEISTDIPIAGGKLKLINTDATKY
jgi:hypothetical protein